MDTEIICISSDDESDSQKENKKNKSLANSVGTDTAFLVPGKMETLPNDEEKVGGNNLKRKILQINKEETIHNMEKKKKLNTNQDLPKVVDISIPESGLYSMSVPEVHLIDKSDGIQPHKDWEAIKKPKLIVKEKKKISYVAHDVFPLFISLCLQKSQDNEKKDMEKIVNKLKRRYDDLDPVYASSENFVSFINEKREAIMSDDKKIYVYIEEVMNEMKKKIKKKSQGLQNNETYDAVPSTSYATKNLSVEENTVEFVDCYNDNEASASPKTRKTIKKITFAMAKCEAMIKRLEEEEVDFEEENDSNYIKVERYKHRIVELYNKLCELTGENSDAGRVYLRPKHLNTTRIVAVDQAITNFINSKITQRNQMKKTGNLTNDLIFPDYRDILECVSRCNDKKNLGLDKRKQEKMAKTAFVELGEHLQRTRRNDYWDTFSLYLENSMEDPAIKDKDLAKKLADNRNEGEKRLAAVFEKYTKRQEEMKDQDDNETASEGEESIVDDEDKNKDNLSIASLSEGNSDNEENIDKIVEEKSSPLEKSSPSEKSKTNISSVNVCQDMDKIISNKTIADTLQKKCNKKVKIKMVKKSDIAVSKITSEKYTQATIHKPCSSNTVAIVKKVIDADIQKQDDSRSTVCSTVMDCTSNIRTEEDIADVITEDVPKVITDPVTETVTETTTDAITKDVADMVTGDETEVMLEDITIENMPNDQQSEEEKRPLLRVRSFAKPPTTWEDNRHKADKPAQENAPKVANQIKEVVDLTSEVTAKPSSVVTKCAVQFGDKIVPVAKGQTLVIPRNKNIISVQNITNNYLKVNTRTGQIIAPVRDIRGSTVIRIPSIQASPSQPNQSQNVATIRNEVPLIGNDTIFRIVRSNKPITVSKKLTVQPVSKQADVRSSGTKPK